jgi:hypothetical protein
MGGRPGSAVVGSFGVGVMVSSVVSRVGQRRTTSYDAHQNRLATRPDLIAERGALGRACTDHVGPTSSQTRSQRQRVERGGPTRVAGSAAAESMDAFAAGQTDKR